MTKKKRSYKKKQTFLLFSIESWKKMSKKACIMNTQWLDSYRIIHSKVLCGDGIYYGNVYCTFSGASSWFLLCSTVTSLYNVVYGHECDKKKNCLVWIRFIHRSLFWIKIIETTIINNKKLFVFLLVSSNYIKVNYTNFSVFLFHSIILLPRISDYFYLLVDFILHFCVWFVSNFILR